MTERPTAAELYNGALEGFRRGDLDEAVACLRAGFFENLYVAPTLLDQPWERQAIWYPGAGAEPRAAAEYAERYGRQWRSTSDALRLLADVWGDSLVRGEIRSFINISKAILQSPEGAQRSGLIRERDRFVDPRRIRRTQGEILARIRAGDYRAPLARPRVALILLAARDPAESVAFYRKLFGLEPQRSSRLAGGYAEFELPGVRLAVHGHDRLAEGDPYAIGPPPQALGWGAIFVIRTNDLDRYLENADREGLEVVDRYLHEPGARFFVVKDPSGYLIEVTEEADPRGF